MGTMGHLVWGSICFSGWKRPN